ncbi:beta-propeller domain-containing protein [Streptosporangium soli]|nr:beta-propeller domain-containing protein [Streptosporangium sp. KLBMP 9127]
MSPSIRTARAAAIAVTLATACAACSGTGGPEPASRTAGQGTVNLGNARLVSYSSCDDMLTGLREKAAANVGPWGFGQPVMFREAIQDQAMAKSTPDHSTTNVQEAGVDEPDLVKTDGKRVITVNGGVLRVVDAATRKVTGSLRLVDKNQGFAPADLLVHGDRALVLVSGGGIMSFRADKRPGMEGPRYVLVDLAGKPRIAGTITPRGEHVDARMVGSTVRIVVRSQPDLTFPVPEPSDDVTEAERTRLNQEFVKKAPIDAWLPKYEVTDAAGAGRTESVKCEQVSHPNDYTGTSMLSLHSLDLAAGDDTLAGDDPISVAADGDTVYGTGDSLYVTSNPRWWSPPVIQEPPPDPRPSGDPSMPSLLPEPSGTPAAPREDPTPTEPPLGTTPADPTPAGQTSPDPAPSDPTSTLPADKPTTEPTTGLTITSTPTDKPTITLEATAAPTPTAPPEETEIHRFDVGAAGPPRYVASGKVPGRVLNQYSLSEHEGHLRVATTATSPDGRESESGVHVLAADDLTTTGKVTGLGKDERIYSVRFIGPVGYVVTFRQVDPLYTLDLRDPAAPRVTGELKITGYSAYLHAAGEGRLIGVGQEASEKGRTLGNQVSLFDVSDPAAPRRLSQLFQKESGSEVEWDPHAFLYWPATGQAVLPLNTHDGESSAMVLAISADGITKQGEVKHPKAKAGNGFAPVDPGIRRSLVIGDTLWTVSDGGLKVSDLKTLADQAWIPFD